jgi:hypothetical protein
MLPYPSADNSDCELRGRECSVRCAPNCCLSVPNTSNRGLPRNSVGYMRGDSTRLSGAKGPTLKFTMEVARVHAYGHVCARRRLSTAGRGSRRLRMTEGRRPVLTLPDMVSIAMLAAGVAADSGHAQQTPPMHCGDRRRHHPMVRRHIASFVAQIGLSFLARSAVGASAIAQWPLELGPMWNSSESARVSGERAASRGLRCPFPSVVPGSRLARSRQLRTNDPAVPT